MTLPQLPQLPSTISSKSSPSYLNNNNNDIFNEYLTNKLSRSPSNDSYEGEEEYYNYHKIGQSIEMNSTSSWYCNKC